MCMYDTDVDVHELNMSVYESETGMHESDTGAFELYVDALTQVRVGINDLLANVNQI